MMMMMMMMMTMMMMMMTMMTMMMMVMMMMMMMMTPNDIVCVEPLLEANDSRSLCEYMRNYSRAEFTVYRDVLAVHSTDADLIMVTHLSYSRLNRFSILSEHWRGRHLLHFIII